MSLTRPEHDPDWSDSYSGTLGTGPMTAREAYETGFSRMPKWAQIALALRNKVVAFMGLQTDVGGAELMTHLPVVEDTPNAFEVGLIDKHLTFTIRTTTQADRIRVTTSIWFNHWLGRIYLLIVLIPHKIIVSTIVRRLA